MIIYACNVCKKEAFKLQWTIEGGRVVTIAVHDPADKDFMLCLACTKQLLMEIISISENPSE